MSNVLITGGGSGLGREIADHLSDRGHNVYVIDRVDISDLDPLHIRKVKGYFRLDMAQLDSLKNVVASGDFPQIDILVNNVGSRVFSAYSAFNETEIDMYIDANLKSNLILTRRLLVKMRERNYGRIINIGSRAAFYGYSTGSLYCATKGFLLRFTEALAKDLKTAGHNVTANAICPNALTLRDGTILNNHNKTVAIILGYVDTIIASTVNGKCYNTFTIGEKMYFLYKTSRNLL